MLKDEGNRREEDTQEIIRKRETSWDVSHQDTVEIEMVSSNRSVWELDKVGIGENWEEEKVCCNPELQSPEEMSTEDKLQGPVGNTFVEYGVVNRKRIRKIYEPRSLEMEPMMKKASNIQNGVSAPS